MSARPAPLADAEMVLGPQLAAFPSALAMARALVGWALATRREGGWAAGVVVETEAYDGSCAASHSFRGPSPRNRAMFGPPGHLYVYRSYGLHWCLNITCGAVGEGAAVLIRALAPLVGETLMARRRGIDPGALNPTGQRRLCAGPGNLARALAVGGADDGLRLGDGGVSLWAWPGRRAPPLATTPRIGISRQAERPWRVIAADSRFLSRPFPGAAAAARALPAPTQAALRRSGASG